jgi:hypothetical protein
MRRSMLAALPVLFLVGSLAAVRGNEAPPRDPAPVAQKAKLVVEVDAKAKEPRLIIPRSLANPPKKASSLNVPTVVAGVALTLAMVSAGFWFIRRGPGRSVAAAVVVFSLFALGVSALYAENPEEPKPRPATTVRLPANVQLQEDVVIEFVEKGDVIKLIVRDASALPQGDKLESPKQE